MNENDKIVEITKSNNNSSSDRGMNIDVCAEIPTMPTDPQYAFAYIKFQNTVELYSPQEALENGLVDREGYLEDAVDRAIELAGLPKETTQVFIYEEKQTFSDVMSAAQKKLVRSQADEVREMAVPRASYLWQADN